MRLANLMATQTLALGGTADGRTECVWVAAWDLSDDLLKFLPDSSSYVWFWKLNGKIPLHAGSAL